MLTFAMRHMHMREAHLAPARIVRTVPGTYLDQYGASHKCLAIVEDANVAYTGHSEDRGTDEEGRQHTAFQFRDEAGRFYMRHCPWSYEFVRDDDRKRFVYYRPPPDHSLWDPIMLPAGDCDTVTDTRAPRPEAG